MISAALALILYLGPVRHPDGPLLYDARTSIREPLDRHPRPLLQLRP